MYRVLFGGSFDPVHNGHLAMADAVHREKSPDQLIWMPARQAPHKLDRCPATGGDRLALLLAATMDRRQDFVCDWELGRPGPSYTVDTLRQLKSQDPEGSIDLVLGLDSLSHLATWFELEEIFQLAGFLFLPRDGWAAENAEEFRAELMPELQDQFRAQVLFMQPMPMSSTEIRRLLAAGESCDRLMPAAVVAEIERRGLYSPA